MLDWMLMPLRKYATFTGRARRLEYWAFVLFVALGALMAQLLDAIFGFGSITTPVYSNIWGSSFGFYAKAGWLTFTFDLAVLIPAFSVAVRRLHDGNHSGWLLLWMLLPLFGWVVLLVLYCLKGTPGPNRFGLDPLAPD